MLLLAFPAALPAQEQRIAAIVNDDVVSAQDLNERLGLVLLTSRIQDQEQARRQLSPQVLRSLIEESLQLQEAKRLSIDVAPDELDRALADIASRNQMSPDQLEQMLASNRIDPKTLKNQLRAQISWLKIVNQRLRPQVNVTVDQLEIAVEEAKRNQGQPEYLLSEIVLPVDNPRDEARVASDAARLVRTLSEGASFDALARQVSASATARRGGDVGWVPASTIPSELAAALERLNPGDVSEPLRSPVGFYIFQLRDRRLGAAPSTEGNERTPIEVKLSQVLFAADIRNEDELSARVDEAGSLRTRLTDCAAVNAVAEELQAPASGDLGLVGGDHVHDHAALEHVGEPPLHPEGAGGRVLLRLGHGPTLRGGPWSTRSSNGRDRCSFPGGAPEPHPPPRVLALTGCGRGRLRPRVGPRSPYPTSSTWTAPSSGSTTQVLPGSSWANEPLRARYWAGRARARWSH
jgi:parvulin-like peptidyl-prolyl isomerase